MCTRNTLLLTPWMAPHRIVDWYTAICMQILGKIDILEIYDETVSSPSTTMSVPAVARLKKPVSVNKKGVKFSRINVLTRDGFQCCYCGAAKPMRELNYDHVVPRHKGGKTVWENIVTSCYPCNARKANKTPEQAGMKLLKKPYRPKTLPMNTPLIGMRDLPEEWRPYVRSEDVNIHAVG